MAKIFQGWRVSVSRLSTSIDPKMKKILDKEFERIDENKVLILWHKIFST